MRTCASAHLTPCSMADILLASLLMSTEMSTVQAGRTSLSSAEEALCRLLLLQRQLL
jgi:hypothetical protein